ncbi:MAG: phosphoribosylamine--glycine ligase, partial [Anaerolineae bacterium]|nr:phosphoribosylamine--glycine ligase [Anaerolineae bacterium]
PSRQDTVYNRVAWQTLKGLAKEGLSFVGVLYVNMMLTSAEAKVLEYNIRFGDPEAPMFMRRLKSDLFEVIMVCLERRTLELEWHPGVATAVTLASAGYPGKYEIGKLITGIEEADQVPGVKVFHAGTVLRHGEYYTAGGRVATVTALGVDLVEAQARAQEAISHIHFDGMTYAESLLR